MLAVRCNLVDRSEESPYETGQHVLWRVEWREPTTMGGDEAAYRRGTVEVGTLPKGQAEDPITAQGMQYNLDTRVEHEPPFSEPTTWHEYRIEPLKDRRRRCRRCADVDWLQGHTPCANLEHRSNPLQK